MDVVRLAKQLGIDKTDVISKAKEFLSLANVRISGGLGQGEVCKAAVCLELACLTAQSTKEYTREKFVKVGCVNAKVYTNTFNMLQQTLGATRKVDLQHLVMQFGCASVRQSVVRVLQLYKERFVAKLPDSDKALADFGRSVFLAVAFWLVARKNKIKVEQKALLDAMCVTKEDFLDISASMYQLCFDVVGIEKTKKKAVTRKTNTAVMDNHRQELSESDEETAGPSGRAATEQKTSKAAGTFKRAKKQADYDDWKLLVLSGKAGGLSHQSSYQDGNGSGNGRAGTKRKPNAQQEGRVSEGNGKFKQAKLAF